MVVGPKARVVGVRECGLVKKGGEFFFRIFCILEFGLGFFLRGVKLTDLQLLKVLMLG
jgi:hypothetical protein